MNGTTLCPHCNTRFRIGAAQLQAHHGMVRCGSCLKAFDARPGFIPDQPGPPPELTTPDHAPAVAPPAETTPAVDQAAPADQTAPAEPAVEEAAVQAGTADAGGLPETPPAEDQAGAPLDFSQPAAIEAQAPVSPPQPPSSSSTLEVLQPITLAEQVAIVPDEEGGEPQPGYRDLNWVIGSALLVLVLAMQAAYFFRVELAASTPGLKPALTAYGKMFGGKLSLPQDASLMSIESSDLEADPAHDNRVILHVLLRNRATYAQAFPNLELTLNDTQDRPLARRTFVPKDYLPPQENEKAGMQPNHELSVKLELGTADLKPTGYRLALHYPKQ